MSIRASESLNLYDGSPHVVVLYLYALQSPLDFQSQRVEDLLRGEQPNGMLFDRPLEITVSPSESRDLEQELPIPTKAVGIVADYYRAPDGQDGARKALVEPGCGFLGFGRSELLLSPSDVQLQ